MEDYLDPYLGIVAACLLAMVIVVLSTIYPVKNHQVTQIPTASSSLAVVPGFTLPTLSLPNTVLSVETSTTETKSVATSSTKVTRQTSSEPRSLARSPILKPAANSSVTEQTTPSSSEPTQSAAQLRQALVNIICIVRGSRSIFSISGSGVIVDSKGIILTNAHIGQYFLLKDNKVSCTIRTGGPATDKYTADLMYISPAWIGANPGIIAQLKPKGTGEFDFALLGITGSATSDPLPASFPSVPLANKAPEIGTSIAVATYGAQTLTSEQIKNSLFPTVVLGTVESWLTFDTNTPDVIALGGSAAAQEGSSGGGVINVTGQLVGTITTSKVEGDFSARSINALTASYIRAQYERETGHTLTSLLLQSPVVSVASFESERSHLEDLLLSQLP